MTIAQITNPLLRPESPLNQGALGAPAGFAALLKIILSTLFAIGALIFFFTFLFGAIRWITSSGNQENLEKARSTIVQALTGLFILLSLFAIAKLISLLFGINLLEIDLGAIRLKP